ncbi:MAG: flagellar hook-basal body complex protein FliE [Lachnospiraceae bacterium]|nr:flagellar hook-basal body complex protein FliE [Lachnospiraceae bacterium]
MDINSFYNLSSGAIRNAAKETSAGLLAEPGSFDGIFEKALDNIRTTNSYISDAENEQIKWALGETENTHELTIALQKAQTALQYTVAIRDKLLSAYNSIMQIQV